MKPMCTLRNRERNCCTSTSLILLFLSFSAGRCTAQETSSSDTAFIIGVSLPITLFVLAVIAICVCFWGCYLRVSMLARQPQRPRYVHNYQRPHQAVHPQSQATSNGQPNSTATVITPPSTNLNLPPTGSDSSTSQTVPQASESTSLLEATLHQGDAPPAYAEAIRMKTVVVIDET